MHIAPAGPGANRTYGSYWTRMTPAWGTRPLDQISASDIEARHHRMGLDRALNAATAATAGAPANT